MEPEQIADVLAETREYIEEHGWVRGELVLGGHVCIMGGVVKSQGWIDDDTHVHLSKIGHVNEVLYKVWQILFPNAELPESNVLLMRGSLAEASSMVVQWNDVQAETEQEVLDLLAKAEKTVRAGFDPDA